MNRKKLISLGLAILLALSFVMNVGAEDYQTLKDPVYATVIEVIDGDAIQAKLNDGKIALVKFIGVKTNGDDNAYQYLCDNLLGQKVYLTTDPSVKASSPWNYAYVYLKNNLVNSKVLNLGLGVLNEDHKNSSLYSTLQKDQANAKNSSMGLWNQGYQSGVFVYNGDKVNINTASREQLKNLLEDSNYSLADSIVKYRESHPFQVITDIKFVKGMTKDKFDPIRQRIVVCTNIRTASEAELRTLKNIDDQQVVSIVNYRNKYGFYGIDELSKYGLVSTAVLNLNKYFIDVQDRDSIVHSINGYVVNINTASTAQLVSAGLYESTALSYISQRNKFPIKSLYDLHNMAGTFATVDNLEALADNIHVATDINNATEYELGSLLYSAGGTNNDVKAIVNNRPYTDLSQLKKYISTDKYNQIAPYAYVGAFAPDYVNINTAAYSQLISYGYTESQARAITNKRHEMLKPADVTMDLGYLKAASSLYTNINVASYRELMSLSEFMTQDIVNRIISYRTEQPFGSAQEISDFFHDNGFGSVYSLFKDFIVVR